MWDHFVQHAKAIRPHLVLITGDCVDTPWRWTLRAAKHKIDALETDLNAGRSEPEKCQIRITPGNHDVRLTGLIPVRPWLTIPLFVGLLTLPLLLAWSCSLLSLTMVGILSGSFAGLLIVLHACCIGRFADVFRDRIKTNPEQFTANNIHVDLYHFDSATTPFWSAEGFIKTKDFLTATTNPDIHPPMDPPRGPSSEEPPPALQNDHTPSYALGMTHHHALGIPHDSQHENLMIMRNSGSFLSELANRKIRLVIHGHKHHPNFSRVSINAERPNEFEIGLLGAGTLTRGNPMPERYGFHFYALELDANLNMKAIPYLSVDGGAFIEQEAFYIEDLQQAIRRQRQFAQDLYGLKASGLKARAIIYSDGDTLERLEHHNFTVTDPKKTYQAQPSPALAAVDRGHIEGFVAGSLSEHCPPGIHLQHDSDPKQFTLRQQRGTVTFGSAIYHTSTPFTFYTQFNALNSFAMSIQQHQQRYGLDPQPRYEETTTTTPVWPVDKLEIVIQFPKEFQFAGLPELIIQNSHSQRLNLIEQEYRSALLYDPDLNTIRLSIPHPPPNTHFVIRWMLADIQPPEARAIASLSGATRQLQRSLIHDIWNDERTAINPHMHAFFRRVGQGINDMVRVRLLIDNPTRDPLEISVMVYDTDTQRLRIVAGNFEPTDPLAVTTLEFGDGVGGRAYKNNAPRLFNKAEGLSTGKPLGYLPWTTFPSVQGIPHEVLLCIPLTNPENTNLIYGVLNIGSARADSRLLQFAAVTGEPAATTQHREDTYAFMNLTCWQFLNATVQTTP